jgi:phage repressor protein C with HTH and peptisase S24 domain
MAPRWEKGDLILVKHEPPKELDDYVLLEMRSGALVVRLLEAMTAETLSFTKHNPPETVTIQRSDVKAMHRVISLEEALASA